MYYICFTEEGTKDLCTRYNQDFNENKTWYDGYKLNEVELYNPKSVVKQLNQESALTTWFKQVREAVSNFMNYDLEELKDVITKMLLGDGRCRV